MFFYYELQVTENNPLTIIFPAADDKGDRPENSVVFSSLNQKIFLLYF